MERRQNWNPTPHHIVLQQQQQQQQTTSSSHLSMITDNARFGIIDAVSIRPGIWDIHREKTTPANRKQLFMEVTDIVNQQYGLHPQLSLEEVEKIWKNLKDTFVKARKKITFNREGCVIRPRWKFFESLTFLEGMYNQIEYAQQKMLKRTDDTADQLTPTKRSKQDDPNQDDSDEFMIFCKSLYFPLKEIASKDRIEYLKLQKTIRDIVHESQIETLTKPLEL